jgi:hypothetical protein
MGTVDQGFVPAPPGEVYARLADLERYGDWWPGARVTLSEDGPILHVRRAFEAPVVLGERRPGTGVVLKLGRGGADGSLEWYLEAFKDGTVVNAILELGGPGAGTEARTMRARRSLRGAMVALRRWGEAR